MNRKVLKLHVVVTVSLWIYLISWSDGYAINEKSLDSRNTDLGKSLNDADENASTNDGAMEGREHFHTSYVGGCAICEAARKNKHKTGKEQKKDRTIKLSKEIMKKGKQDKEQWSKGKEQQLNKNAAQKHQGEMKEEKKNVPRKINYESSNESTRLKEDQQSDENDNKELKDQTDNKKSTKDKNAPTNKNAGLKADKQVETNQSTGNKEQKEKIRETKEKGNLETATAKELQKDNVEATEGNSRSNEQSEEKDDKEPKEKGRAKKSKETTKTETEKKPLKGNVEVPKDNARSKEEPEEKDNKESKGQEEDEEKSKIED